MLFRLISSPSTDFPAWFNHNYLPFLQELRCEHSKQKKPCPTIKAAWDSVCETGTLDQHKLNFALGLTVDTATANKSLIQADSQSRQTIRHFLKQLQKSPDVSADNKTLARRIQLNLELSNSMCRIS